jgi:hypothetical protein
MKGFHVVHAIPGRVRLRVDKVKGNPDFAQQVQDRLRRVPGIEGIETTPFTGSVLICFDVAKLLAGGGLATIAEEFSALFPEVEASSLNLHLESLMDRLIASGNPRPSSNLVQSMSSLNAGVARLTGGIDLKLLVPLTLMFLGVRSLWTSKETSFPSWYDYFWFAFSTFAMLNLRTSAGKEE